MAKRCEMLRCVTSFMIMMMTIMFISAFAHPIGTRGGGAGLSADYYAKTCPQAQNIIREGVEDAVKKEARMAASLLRLHFHDCFVKGCDASLLLDNDTSHGIVTEKISNPNRNSARGFEVIDDIKSRLEKACPRTVSCADILAVAARDSVELTGGLGWEVVLGRRDGRSASLSGSNNNIPAPNSTLQTLVTKFKAQGLGVIDLVALSGSHTIGQSRCTSFRQRLYNQSGNGQPDSTLDESLFPQLRSVCPPAGRGGDNNLFPLDSVTPTSFDSSYFGNLIKERGVLNSDEVLFSKASNEMKQLVQLYAANQKAFFVQFAESMVKMGNISPLASPAGEVRVNCRAINTS